jgi:methionyl-tRNA formyltransferase
MNQKLKVVLMGTPEFGISTFEEISKRYDIIGVFCNEDKKVGRKKILQKPPVKIWAESKNFPVLQPNNFSETFVQEWFKENTPDIGIIIAYGHLIPESIFSLPRFGMLNVHASLLPYWRGASPIQSSLLHGEKTTGITLQKITKELDAGDIIFQKNCDISDNDTYTTLSQKLATLSQNSIPGALGEYISTQKSHTQNHTQATYCCKITKKDGIIHPTQETSEEICNKYRAYIAWPEISLQYKTVYLKIKTLQNSSLLETHHIPGTLFKEDNNIYLTCKTGYIMVEKIQYPGKKEMDIHTFLRGHADILNYQFSQ